METMKVFLIYRWQEIGRWEVANIYNSKDTAELWIAKMVGEQRGQLGDWRIAEWRVEG